MSLEIEAVQFQDGGMMIQYVEIPADVRVEGRLMKTHSLMISAAHPDYREDMKELERHAQRVLRNALEDFDDSEPYMPPEVDALDLEDDDAPIEGMGDG